MPEEISISEAESVVMEVLWARGVQTAESICEALAPKHDWQASTVKTLLSRLLKKGAIRAEPEGRRYVYSALLQRDDWVSATSAGLLDRLFGGRVAPLVAHFSRQRRLGKRDIAELKRLLQELDK